MKKKNESFLVLLPTLEAKFTGVSTKRLQRVLETGPQQTISTFPGICLVYRPKGQGPPASQGFCPLFMAQNRVPLKYCCLRTLNTFCSTKRAPFYHQLWTTDFPSVNPVVINQDTAKSFAGISCLQRSLSWWMLLAPCCVSPTRSAAHPWTVAQIKAH